jgi:enoyl-CoA hydratase/carnithine racemase
MVTIGKGKHFSLGLDLEGLVSLSAAEVMEFSNKLQKLLGRILTFPLVTVAAINGKL